MLLLWVIDAICVSISILYYSGSQPFSDRVFVGPVLSARNTFFQKKSTYQILFDQNF